MKHVFSLLLIALLLAGCASRPPPHTVTLDEIRNTSEARLQEEQRARLVVTLRDERVAELTSATNTDLQQYFREEGLRLAREVRMKLVDHYAIAPLKLYVYVLEGDSSRVVDRAVHRLQKIPGVQRVQRANLFRTQLAESAGADDADPLGPLQAIPVEEIARLHALATGRGIRIAIVDTGIDSNHEDLRGASLEARDLVIGNDTVPVETHATAVAGIIIAQGNNGLGIKGIAPAAHVIALRACWQHSGQDSAYCNTFTLAKALAAALDADVDIVNLSLTGPMDPLLVQLVDALLERNIIVIAANADEPGQGPFPSRLPGVISATSRPVLARDPGPVYAPGDNIITLLPDNRYGLRDGSSISAAQVSGVASLFRERNPALTANAFESLLRGHGVEGEGMAGLIEALEMVGR